MDEGIAAGARARQLALLLGIGLTTLQRWRRQFAGDGGGVDCRKGSHRNVSHRLSAEERQRILLTCNEPEFAALPPGQIVPILADRGLFIGSERSFYRVLHCHGQPTAAVTATQAEARKAHRRIQGAIALWISAARLGNRLPVRSDDGWPHPQVLERDR